MSSGNVSTRTAMSEGAWNKKIFGGFAVAFAIVYVANFLAGKGSVDGWLSWGVFTSALVMTIAFGILGIITRTVSGHGLRLDDLPTWFVVSAAALSVTYLASAVIIVVTP